MDDAAGSTEDRLFKFLLSRGLSPGDALSLAKAEMANRAQDTIRNQQDTVRNQEYARQNPGSLSREMGIDPSLPGSDPTAGPVSGGERPQASTPMTNAQIDEMRITRPMVRDDRPAWVQNRGQSQPEPTRMPTLGELRFLYGRRGEPGYEERRAEYDTLANARKVEAANPRTMQQTYNPAGGSDAPSSANMVDRALAAVMGSTPPSSAAAATPSAPSGEQAGAAPTPAPPPQTNPGPSLSSILVGRPPTLTNVPSGGNRISTPPLPAPRPAPEAETARPGLFSGRDFQSTGQRVVERPQDGQRATLNWGDADNAADFARADKAMQSLEKNKEEFEGRASGGAANGRSNKPSNGRDAALHKALEIIQSLLMHRR